MLTNEDLIYKAKKGDLDSYNELFQKNSGLSWHIAKRYINCGELEELASIATLGMMKAYITFDISRNIKFVTYAARIMTNDILVYDRRNKKRKNDIYLDDAIMYDNNGNMLTYMDILESDIGNPEDIIYKEEIIIIRQLVDELSERDKAIIMLRFYAGKTQKETGAELGYSQSYITRLEKKILSKLKDRYDLIMYGRES